MTWLLLTAAGLVAELVVIVLLGRAVTARDDPGDRLPSLPDPPARGSGRGIRLALVDDDRGALTERLDGVREATT